MSRSSTCLLCFQRALWQTPLLLSKASAPWLQQRTLAQAQKRRPARNVLSSSVAEGNGARLKRSTKHRIPGPFGGMNLRSARIRGPPRTQTSTVRKRSRDAVSRTSTKPQTPAVRNGSRDATSKTSTAPEFKALKMQRALFQVPYAQRSSVKTQIREVDSFDKFALLPAVRDAVYNQVLHGLESISPTPVQRLAIPALLQGSSLPSKPGRERKGDDSMKQFLLGAETGSGKTLAYLLPTIDAIKRAEAIEAEIKAEEERRLEERQKQSLFDIEPPPLSSEPNPNQGRPRAVVLFPTAELVSQAGGVAKLLSHTIKFRAALISSAYSPRVIRNRVFNPAGVDILFATPHLLASIAEVEPNVLSRVTHLIVDEADSLFDRSFGRLTSAILDRASPSMRQLVLCSATIPRSLDSYTRRRFPAMERLVTPNLHAIPRRVQLGIVDVEKEPYRGNKNLACADTIWTIGRSADEHMLMMGENKKEKIDVKRVIVFVNERETATELAAYLVTKGIQASALNRDTSEQRQSELLSFFTSPATEMPSDPGSGKSASPTSSPSAEASTRQDRPRSSATSSSPRRSLPNTRVLVMTDLGSRGIDTIAVRHVVLYDVPHTTIDFIHRLGRTGRMGKRGRGVVLVGKHDRKDVVKEVREGMFRGQALI